MSISRKLLFFVLKLLKTPSEFVLIIDAFTYPTGYSRLEKGLLRNSCSDDLILGDCDPNVIKYYYKDKKILPLNRFNNINIAGGYKRIFIIYIYKEPKIEEFKDYAITQEYFPRGIGLLQLDKI